MKVINSALGLLLVLNICFLIARELRIRNAALSDVAVVDNARADIALKIQKATAQQAGATIQPVIPAVLNPRPPTRAADPIIVQRRKAAGPYLDFLYALNLTAPQRERVIQLLVDKRNSDRKIKSVMAEYGEHVETSANAEAIFLSLSRENSAELLALLGGAKFAMLQQLPAHAHFRTAIETNYGFDLQAAGLPIEPGKVEAVSWRFVEHLKSKHADNLAVRDHDDLSPNERALLADLAELLDPQRVSVLKNAMQEKNRVRRIMSEYPDLDFTL